ncbi:flagellar filament capping protein FliD [Undibacterium sp.]|uniref:flagellar filament capping protein FliD n=1 Tax=Undibacterium sp. TaxID=1914977 RepID=UPI00374CE629
MSVTATTGAIDVNSIVSQLMTVEAQPLQLLQVKEASYTSKLSAYGNLSSALSAFQSTLTSLGDASKFNALSATPADATVLSASAGAGASAGNYNINISQLAQAQSLAAAGQTSTTATIGSGAATTLTFEFGSVTGGTLGTDGTYTGSTFTEDGTKGAGTITIDSSNNSLQGIKDAINKAGLGVTASIVSDGSASPNRLVLTSTTTGQTSSLKIQVSGDAAIQNLLAYDPAGTQNLSQKIAGQDAKATIGGLDVTSPTNDFTNIPGVTVTATKIGSTSLNLSADTSSVTTSVNAFVKAYNDLNTTITGLTQPGTQSGGLGTAPTGGGPLVGDATTRNIQNAVRKIFTTNVPGLNGSLTNLSQIGITFQDDGTLALDSSKLSTALKNTPGDVQKLLASSGSTTDSLVKFVSAGNTSPVGSNAINVTALATQGSVVGSTAAGLNINSGNNTLNLTINGTTASINLTPSNTPYTASSLATQLQSLINGNGTFSGAGINVTVSQNNGVFTITSNKYGSASKVSVSGSASANLFGTTTETTGTDIEGTIGGAPAAGSGTTLTGSDGGPAAGIKVDISGGVLGDRGTVNYSSGYASMFSSLIDSYIGTNGSIKSANDSINASIKSINKASDDLNTQLIATQKRLTAQYTALNVSLSSMQTTSNFLTQQLAKIAAN